MHPLYDELLMLCGDNAHARAAVLTAARAGTPEAFRVKMCKAMRKQFIPAIPAGMMRDGHCFWLKFVARGVWECAWGTDEYRKERAQRAARMAANEWFGVAACS
jgi:hypothetical protein